jgi:hypothetical protein
MLSFLWEERMTDQQQESPAQVGRYLAMTAVFRAIIDILAETLEKPISEVRSDIQTRVDHSTAILRLSAAGNPEWRPSIAKMDAAIKQILRDDEGETH